MCGYVHYWYIPFQQSWVCVLTNDMNTSFVHAVFTLPPRSPNEASRAAIPNPFAIFHLCIFLCAVATAEWWPYLYWDPRAIRYHSCYHNKGMMSPFFRRVCNMTNCEKPDGSVWSFGLNYVRIVRNHVTMCLSYKMFQQDTWTVTDFWTLISLFGRSPLWIN